MSVNTMYMISPHDFDKLKKLSHSSDISSRENHAIKDDVQPTPKLQNDVINDEEQTHMNAVEQEENTGLEILSLALEGVNQKYKNLALQLLRHLSFINQSGNRFQFNPLDFGIHIDGQKIPKTNLVELINTLFKRTGPLTTEEQYLREKKKLSIPGMFPFLKLLSSSGVPASQFGNSLVSEYIRKYRQ